MLIKISSEDGMKRFGQKLAQAIGSSTVIELIGDVGAGKTTFTKGLAAGLGVDEDVQSPSFTISRLYDTTSGLRLAHYDFYRLSDPGILLDELAETQSDARTVTVIEWADIVGGVLPEDRLRLEFTATGENEREIKLSAGGAVSRKVLEQIS